MLGQVPVLLLPDETASQSAAEEVSLSLSKRADGSLVIDVLNRPSLPQQCDTGDADPLDPAIIVCRQTASSPRLSKMIGPEIDDFGSAIPRARVKLSDKAEGQVNLINKGVGNWNANGGEVRLKIDF